jgi:hypothetical protein
MLDTACARATATSSSASTAWASAYLRAGARDQCYRHQYCTREAHQRMIVNQIVFSRALLCIVRNFKTRSGELPLMDDDGFEDAAVLR